VEVTEFLRVRWPWLSVAARLLVGGVWIAAGWLKLTESPEAQDRAVRAYQLLPESLVPLVGRGLPALEVIVGLLLIVGLGVRVVSVLSALLLAAFIFGISAAWVRGLQIECGCFGGGGSLAQDATAKYPWDIARDAGLLLLSAALALWPHSKVAVDRLLLRPVETAA
jgi:uncharacterized membrane protein YphA (DoxX/SURF4 family)